MVANHIGGIQYTDFLERTLPNLLEDTPLNVHKGMWFHHYSAPPYACNWLKTIFQMYGLTAEVQFSGLHVHLTWTPSIFSYGVASKKMVYTVEVEDNDSLINCIPVAVTNIRGWPKQLVHVSDSTHIAVKQCMRAGGSNFRQYLWRN
jgi:hypothetical protein